MDGYKIASATTWTPQKFPVPYRLELDAAPFDSTQPLFTLKDRIDFVFRAKTWNRCPIVYIGVYNSHPEDGPVNYSIRMRDIPYMSTYTPKIKIISQLFDRALKGIDA